MDDTQVTHLESLLNEADLDIVDWITGRQAVSNINYLPFIEHMQTLHEKHLAEN